MVEITRKPNHTHKYWLYDPEGDGMLYFKTKAARDCAARDAIAHYEYYGERMANRIGE